jgi:hypothetical protein
MPLDAPVTIAARCAMLSLPPRWSVVRGEDRITHARSDSPVSRTPELLILLLVAVLAAGAVALGGRGSGSVTSPESTVTPAHIRLVERRVEALRHLRFRRPVPVAVVSPAQARREGTAEAARSEPPARQRATEELLKLLGLLPADADLRAIEASVFAEQVAGYYDPRRKRLALVRGAGVDDITLAHELTHALEDQHVALERLGSSPAGAGDDASTAQQALVEGSATLVMERYAERWPSDAPLGDALAGLAQVTAATPLPQYIARSLVFPYFQGERFVQALLDAGDGRWTLVNVAERARPPVSTAEILQPTRWLRAQQPAPVSLRDTARTLTAADAGWHRIAGSTLGAEDVAALLSPSSGPLAARRLTAGWRGGRYALWRRGSLAPVGCATPCRARDTAIFAVRMGAAPSARRLGAGLAAWLARTLDARPVATDAHGGVWRLPGSSAGAVRVQGTTVRLALAPTGALAGRLTR